MQLFILDDIPVRYVHGTFFIHSRVLLYNMGPIYAPDMSTFVFGEHTADIWISAKGSSAPLVLSRMVEGLYGTISESYVLEEDLGKMELCFSSATEEELLVMMLAEALFLIDTTSVVILGSEFVLIDRASLGEKQLTMRGRGFKVSIVPEKRGMEVKAVTRHGTCFGKKGDSWEARVLLDI